MNNWVRGKDYPEFMTDAGLKTLTNGYLLPGETPRNMYERVAMSAASQYWAHDEKMLGYWFFKFFDYMWKGWLCPASPILANLGTDRGLPISCLVGDSWIHTKNDGGKLIKDIEIGDEVLTHKGRFRKVIGKQKRKSKNDLFLLKVATRSTPIKITGNHPVLTNLGWVRVDELEINKHLVATNKSIEYQPKDHFIELVNNNISDSTKVNKKVFVDNDLAWAIGLWFAEGSITKGANKKPNGIRLTMGVHEKDVTERAVKIFKDKFTVNGNMYESSYQKNKKTARWIIANINSTILGEYFCKEFGVGCKNKNVSEWIKNLPKDKLMSFLQGVMDGDGSKKYSSGKIISNRITLANPKLILSLYEIALKCNYRVSLNFEEKAGKLSSDKFVYSIYVRYSDSMYIKSGIDFGDLIYCPITKLERLDINEDVYDITVEEDHSFTVAGVVVHNCFGLDTPDSMYGIGQTNLELMMLTKAGGGVGINLNSVRGRGAPIKNNGFSEGVVPWAKIFDSTIIASNQGSTRKGAASVNLYVDHTDIEEFLRIRRASGDVNRQCLNINHCVLITDAFMNRVESGESKARELFKEILRTRMETGEPYLMFIDNVNRANPEAYKKNNLNVSMTNICCLSGDTLVWTNQGPQKIEDLVNKEVEIFDGNGIVKNNSFELKGRTDLYRVYIKDGSYIDCTDNHRWFVSKNYNDIRYFKTTETLTKDLQVGDFIEYHQKPFHGDIAVKSAYIKGFLVGDGTRIKDRPVLWLYDTKFMCEEKLIKSAQETDIIEERTNSISELSFTEPKTYVNDKFYGKSITRKILRGLAVRKEEFIKWSTDYKVNLPKEIFSWNKESKLEFLSGLFDSDGTIGKNNSLQLSSKNLSFIIDLQFLIKTFGWSANIDSVKDLHRITLSSYDAYDFMTQSSCQRLKIKSKSPNRKTTGWRQVVKIEKLEGKHKVYCPTVPSTGKFALANGLMTGNSEITLFTNNDHGFVCCLSSLNLVEWDKWKDTDLVEVTTVFLDCVMEEFLKKANGISGFQRVFNGAVKGRPIGIGVIGWHTLLQNKMLPFDTSIEVMRLNSQIFKHIHDKSKEASQMLAAKLGEPEWCKGTGMRNTHTIAIAPTVSNSKIAGGHSPSIEPIAANAYADKTSKGVFLYKNPQLMTLLQSKEQDTPEVWKSIVTEEGSVQHLNFLTDQEKKVFLTAREINQMNIITQAAARQPYIDQAQSLNLFFPANVDSKWLYKIHLEAWKKGLKTLYYTRTSSVLKGDVASRFYDDSCKACEG